MCHVPEKGGVIICFNTKESKFIHTGNDLRRTALYSTLAVSKPDQETS